MGSKFGSQDFGDSNMKSNKNGNVSEKIKQQPTDNYESFCYTYTREDTKRKYTGKRKGCPGDGYKHSSKNTDLADDLRNSDLSFTYSQAKHNPTHNN